MDETKDLVRQYLKVLLLHLAAKSDTPGLDLQRILHEVIGELHQEVKEVLESKPRLRLVMNSDKEIS